MEKVINVLYEIEEKANRILDRASEQKQKLYEQLNSDLEALESTITSDTNEKINAMKANMESELASERSALTTDCERQIQALQDNFTNNHDVLVEKLFQHIIEV